MVTCKTGFSQTYWKTTGDSVGSGTFIGTTNNQALNFKANNVQAMSILTNGNVSVNGTLSLGTGSPFSINGATGTITSTSQTVGFGNDTIATGGAIKNTFLGFENTAANSALTAGISLWPSGWPGGGISYENCKCITPMKAMTFGACGFIFANGLPVAATNNQLPTAFNNTFMGIGTANPDAGLSISTACNNQFSVIQPNATNDVFTIDGYGDVYAAGSGSIAQGLTVNTTNQYGLTATFLNNVNNSNSAIFFAENMQAGDYNSLTEADDNGIFWADNYGTQNNNSGLVIAPWNHSPTGVGMRIDHYGNVGIGIPNPTEALVVEANPNDGASGVVGEFLNGNTGVLINSNMPAGSFNNLTQTNDNGIFWEDNSLSNGFVIAPWGGPPNAGIRIDPSGNVGIGLVPGNPIYQLSVNGTIWCTEVKVCIGTCDFVFDKDYKLMPLNELENYLELNHHLPGIASAQEMEGGDGVELGKMNSQLLQKVEELTLYTIQLKKQLDEMQAEITKMSAGIPSGKESK